MSLSKTFYFESGGAAIDLDVGFVSDRIDLKNNKKWATDGNVVESHWNKQMTAGYSLNAIADDTGINRSISTSNGFTPYNDTDVTNQQATISGATPASPCVLTVTAHGLGSTADTITVRVRDMAVGGMVELNGNMYKAYIVGVNSVRLMTMEGDDLDASAFTAYTSGGILYSLSGVVENEGSAGVTLGTDIVGVDGDLIEVTCYQDSQFLNLGDLG